MNTYKYRVCKPHGRYILNGGRLGIYFCPSVAVYDDLGIFIENIQTSGYYPSIRVFSKYFKDFGRDVTICFGI